MTKTLNKTWAEFFAGVGLIGHGLKSGRWSIRWANDICPDKIATYRENHDDFGTVLVTGDIHDVDGTTIPHVFGASHTFPCTNTSAAGNRKGLSGKQSSLIYTSLQKMKDMAKVGKDVPLLLLENPTGLISRKKGEDLAELIQSINDEGFTCSLMQVDACHFVPQSRPRLFIVATTEELAGQSMTLRSEAPALFAETIESDLQLYPEPVRKFIKNHPDLNLGCFENVPSLPTRQTMLSDILEQLGQDDAAWISQKQESEMIANMLGPQRDRFEELKNSSKISVSVINRRGRKDPESGVTVNATEINTSGLATCIRPLGGGSSRQWVLFAGQGKARIRTLTAREAARLMGVSDDFKLPSSNTAAFKAMGEAVVVPAIRWIDENVLSPIYSAYKQGKPLTGRKVATVEQMQLPFAI